MVEAEAAAIFGGFVSASALVGDPIPSQPIRSHRVLRAGMGDSGVRLWPNDLFPIDTSDNFDPTQASDPLGGRRTSMDMEMEMRATQQRMSRSHADAPDSSMWRTMIDRHERELAGERAPSMVPHGRSAGLSSSLASRRQRHHDAALGRDASPLDSSPPPNVAGPGVARAHAHAHAHESAGPVPSTATPEERAARWRRVSTAFEQALTRFEQGGGVGSHDEAVLSAFLARAASAAAGEGRAVAAGQSTRDVLMDTARNSSRLYGLYHHPVVDTAAAVGDPGSDSAASGSFAHQHPDLEPRHAHAAHALAANAIHHNHYPHAPHHARAALAQAYAQSQAQTAQYANSHYGQTHPSRRVPSLCALTITPDMDKTERARVVRHIARVVARMAAPQRRTLAASTLERVLWGEMETGDGGSNGGEEGMERDECCAVCQDEVGYSYNTSVVYVAADNIQYEAEDKVAVTACKHMYHASCLEVSRAAVSS